MRSSTLALLLASCSLAAMADPALAQTTTNPADDRAAQVDELVVTAQKREERVQDVPLAISVVGGAQLERQQVNTIFDLSKVAPALEVTNAPGQAVGGGGQIRGIGTQSFGVGAVGAVGIVVDGVSQGNTNISDLFDINRVEVLKGPQGTLFGLTTSAGVINITTRAPSFTELSGRIRTELSDEGTLGSSAYGNQVVQGSLNIPISEVAGMRVAASLNKRQGPGRNALDGTLDEFQSASARARLLFRPSDALSVNLNADYSESDNDGPDFFTVYKADAALTAQLAQCRATTTSAVTPVRPSGANRDYCTTNVITSGNRNFGGSVSVDYAFDNLSLTSITAARRDQVEANASLDIFRLRNAYFLNPIPVPPFVSSSGYVGAPSDIVQYSGPSPGPSNLFTQEVRLQSPADAQLEYTVGLFYSAQTYINSGGATTILADYTGPGSQGFIVNGLPVVSTPGKSSDYSSAVFGQATYHLNDAFSLIAGVRFTREFLKQHSVDASGVAADSRAEIDNTSWRLGGQWKPDDSLMAYGTIAKGYKGPQFAPQICAGVCPAGTPSRVVAAELPMNYEIGAKKMLFDNRVIADLSAFYIKAENYQGQICTTNAQNLLQCTVQNLDGVLSKGIEGNLFGRVSDNFTVNTGLIWNKATFPKSAAGGGPFLSSDGTDLSGKQLVNAPEWKYTFSGEYSRAVATGLEGFVAGDIVFKSKIRYGASADPNVSYPAAWVLGGRFGVRAQDGRWSAALFVRNLTDEHVPILRQGGFPYAGNYGQFLGTSSFRVVGLNLEAGF